MAVKFDNQKSRESMMPLRLNLLTSTGRKPDALALGGAGVVVSGVTLFAVFPMVGHVSLEVDVLHVVSIRVVAFAWQR